MMKVTLDPLTLDKQTIAKLDEAQLREIIGGQAQDVAYTSMACLGSSTCHNTSGACTQGGTAC